MTRKQKIVFRTIPGPKSKRTLVSNITLDCIRAGMMERDIWPILKWLVSEGHVEMVADPHEPSRMRYRQVEQAVTA